jgi:hypothetical protein
LILLVLLVKPTALRRVAVRRVMKPQALLEVLSFLALAALIAVVPQFVSASRRTSSRRSDVLIALLGCRS